MQADLNDPASCIDLLYNVCRSINASAADHEALLSAYRAARAAVSTDEPDAVVPVGAPPVVMVDSDPDE